MKTIKTCHHPKSDHDRPAGRSSEIINRFEKYLRARGHKDSTIHAYVASIKHFVFWIETCPPGAAREINNNIVNTFLEEHLPNCSCPKPVRKDLKNVRAALNQLLMMEGDERARTIISDVPPEIEAAIGNFDKYLKNVCGHSEATRWYHRRHVRIFLSWLFGERPVILDQITPEALSRYVILQANDYCSGSVAVLVYSLRVYLKFLQFNGHVTPSLAATIPKPPYHSAGNLPQALNYRELVRFWSVFDQSTAIGKRDYAMARCLTDLGLRCCEVANIHFNDLDWRNSVLWLPRTKSRREDTLPIMDAVGQAMVTYIRYGRPKTDSRAVFVHHRAPVGKAVQSSTVRGAVRRAFSRAGFLWSGTHILRSTLASRLFEGGGLPSKKSLMYCVIAALIPRNFIRKLIFPVLHAWLYLGQGGCHESVEKYA